MSPRIGWKYSLLALAFATTCVSIFWMVFPFRETNVTDYVDAYRPAAMNLLAGRGLTVDGGELLVDYPPGYPLVLSAVFKAADLLLVSRQFALMVFTIASYGLSALLVSALAADLWGRNAFVPVVVWLTYPPLLWLTTGPFSEIPFLFLFYLSVYVFNRASTRPEAWRYFLVSGVCAGSAALMRPIGLLIAVTLIGSVWMICRDTSKLRRLCLMGCILLGGLAATIP